ncbi:MAG: adenosine kinase [Candidatus Aenigmarchaeota archaeon]|nr:adenosine kinase [Candidatus Aenigmarchaeota archaeon]
MKEYDVFGIGSALVDLLILVEEEKLKDLNLEKGYTHPIDEDRSKELMGKIKGHDVKIIPGGSSANVMAAISVLGGKVVFCGKVGNDEHGRLYEKAMTENNIKSYIAKEEKLTGHAITFITPDSERTMATYKGASLFLAKEDILEEDVKKSKFLHIEGYQLEDPQLRETALHAMNIAKNSDTKISIDLADAGLVKRNLDDIRKIVKDYADVVFANELEAEAFTEMKDEEKAVEELSKFADIAIVKLGERGSLIRGKGQTIRIDVVPTNAVDTTGAGDVYAAGFLHGLCNGFSLAQTGNMASYIASKIVSQIGARLDSTVREDLTLKFL